MERASRFFEKPDFHTLVYRHSDIETEKIKSKSTCASQDLFEKTRNNLHQTANEEATGRTVVYHENHADDAALKYHAINNRQKRAIDNTKTQCTLYIESDHLYYAYWGSNDEAVLNQFAIHVQGINEIYEITGKYPLLSKPKFLFGGIRRGMQCYPYSWNASPLLAAQAYMYKTSVRLKRNNIL